MNKNLNLPSCVIMAGGLGKRLGAITKKIPKPIIKVNNKPFLYYLLDKLILSGFSKFVFVLSYKNRKIIEKLEYYKNKKKLKFIYHIDKKKNQGTFKSLNDIKKDLGKDFFYTNADELPNFSIKKFYKLYKSSSSLITFVLFKNSKLGHFAIKEKRIFCSKKKDKNKYIECGFKFINKRIFKLINSNKKKLENNFLNNYLLKRCNYIEIKKLPYRIDSAHEITNAKKFI